MAMKSAAVNRFSLLALVSSSVASACAFRSTTVVKMLAACAIDTAHLCVSNWGSFDGAPSLGDGDEAPTDGSTMEELVAMSLSSRASAVSTRWFSVGRALRIDRTCCVS